MKDEDYQILAERMEADAFHRGCLLSVLVEDIYDQRFWECMIESVKPDLRNKIDFPFPTPIGTRGKDILKRYRSFVKKNFIICVDSDCEYFYNTDSWYTSEYIYHTVFYSKESFQCYHFSLNEICRDLTNKTYDFEGFLNEISRKIEPIFYFWLYFKENFYKQYDDYINNGTFARILDFEDVQFNNIGDESIWYQVIEDRVNQVLDDLKSSMDESWYNPTFEHDIPALKKRLEEQDLVCQEEILLFCHGHSVLEKFITPFIKRVVKILKNLNIEEARQTLNEATDGVVEDTIKRIENQAKQNLETKLNDGFKCLIYDKNYPSQQIQKIREKMQNELVVCQDCLEGLQPPKTA